MALPVQLPRPLRPAAAAAARPRALSSSPAPSGAIGGGPGGRRTTLLAPQQVRRRRQSMIAAAAALSPPDDPDAPPPYELEDYTAEANAAYWETRPVSVLKRGLVIGIEFARWFATRGSSSTEAARSMRELLTRLGPAFIKVGQALAARPDLLPPDFIAELELLQDRIPPFDDARARALIEEELGAPASQVFSRLSARPVAAASLGQVYRATLAVDPKRTARGDAARAVLASASGYAVGPDEVTNGAPPASSATAGPAARALLSALPPDTPVEVAVKVQRPGVRETIALDVFILRSAAALLRKAKNVNTDLPALVDEWSSSLFGELDYRVEQANGALFKKLYGRLDGVYVPSMVPSLCRQRVLVMEWVEGGRLRSASDSELAQERRRGEGKKAGSSSGAGVSAGSSRASASASSALSSEDELRLVDVGVRCSLEQMMSVGFFHADPHQGNFIRRASDGRLAYIDFGMCARIDDATRRALLTASVHLASREFGSLADDMLALGFFPPGTQRSVVAPALTGVFARAMEGGVQALSFQELSADLGKTMYDYKFRLPTYATLLVRSLTTLEGIARSADREYPGLLQSAYPWIARRLLQSPSPELRGALRALLYRGNRFRFDRLESLLLQAARSPPRPAAMVSLAESPSSKTAAGTAALDGEQEQNQVTAAGGALGLLLSPDAAFVREILVDELAKGLDSGARVAADGARDAAAAAGRQLLGAAAALLPAGSPPRTLLVDPALALQASVDRAVPRAARDEDREQVDGVLRLAGAMREFSRADAARAEAKKGLASSSSSSPSALLSPFALLGDPEDPSSPLASWARAMLPSAAGEAARALAWLAREAAALPPSAAAAAARLPAEVAAKAASRGAARAMRGLAGLSGSGSGSGGGGAPSVAFEMAAEDERTRSAAEASSAPSNSAFASSFSSQPARSKPAAARTAAAAAPAPPQAPPPRPRPVAAAPAPTAAAKPAVVVAPRPTPPPPPPPSQQQKPPVAVVVNGASPVAIAPVAAASFIDDDPILKDIEMIILDEVE